MRHLIVNDDVKIIKCEQYLFVNQLMSDKVMMHNRKIDCSVIKNPWLDKERYQKAHDYIAEFKNKVLSELVVQLNKNYNIEFDYNQWNMLIGIWLTDILFLIYDHYTRITSINEEFDIVINKINVQMQKTISESISCMVCDDNYNAFLYSIICKELGVKVHCKENKNIFKKINKVCYYMQSKYGRRILIDKIMKKQKKSVAVTSTQFNNKVKEDTEVVIIKGRFPAQLEKDIESEFTNKVVFFSDSDFEDIEKQIICSNQTCHHINIDLNNITLNNKYEEIAIKIITNMIPKELMMENFMTIYKKAQDITQRWKIRKIYSSAFVGMDFLASMCACFEYKKNVEIVDIQHSAVYNLNNSLAYHESLIFDDFLTWGWKEDEKKSNCNIKPFYINRIVHPLNMDCFKSSTRILYATNPIEKYEIGRGLICDNYEKKHFQFINELDEFEKTQIVVRLFADDINSTIMHKYTQSYKNIKLENVREIKFYDSLACSKILICDSFGSTHIESMIWNHPVMFFNGIEMPIKNRQVEELLNELKEVYIYADSPKELIDNYRKIENIDDWWNSNSVQNAIKKYLHICANGYDEDLKNIWINELLKSN